MIPITYIRSSLISNAAFCQHQLFLSYVLGLRQKENHKSTLGTVTHKVLELLATGKKTLQNNKGLFGVIKDDDIGVDITFSPEEFLKETCLSNLDVDRLNSTRINKDVYKHPCKIEYGHKRYGVAIVEELIQKCHDYFKKHSPNKWQPVDFKNISNWVWIALDWQDGKFDPRKRNVFDTETYFDFEIEDEWAKYDFGYRGEQLKGQLHLKGTIDLTIQLDENTLELCDFKSGQRLDWASGEIKTYSKLHTDSQLLTYYYASKKLYPDKNILITIWFLRDGGPYSLCFDEETLEKSVKLLKNTYEELQRCKLPVLLDPAQKDFRCTRICDYYKQKIDNQNTCQFIHEQIQLHGIDWVIQNHTAPNFHIDYYEAPGT